jgi:hypothetical protein
MADLTLEEGRISHHARALEAIGPLLRGLSGPLALDSTTLGRQYRGAKGVFSSSRPPEVPMPIDLEKLGEVLVALFIGSSTLLLTAAIAWRLAVKPTMRAILELRATRMGADPVLSRRVTELEEEVRALKDRLGALPEGNPSRVLGTDAPWRGTKEKA